jgi:hypothetical protein
MENLTVKKSNGKATQKDVASINAKNSGITEVIKKTEQVKPNGQETVIKPPVVEAVNEFEKVVEIQTPTKNRS